jgi:hypothetical protein
MMSYLQKVKPVDQRFHEWVDNINKTERTVGFDDGELTIIKSQ